MNQREHQKLLNRNIMSLQNQSLFKVTTVIMKDNIVTDTLLMCYRFRVVNRQRDYLRRDYHRRRQNDVLCDKKGHLIFLIHINGFYKTFTHCLSIHAVVF